MEKSGPFPLRWLGLAVLIAALLLPAPLPGRVRAQDKPPEPVPAFGAPTTAGAAPGTARPPCIPLAEAEREEYAALAGRKAPGSLTQAERARLAELEARDACGRGCGGGIESAGAYTFSYSSGSYSDIRGLAGYSVSTATGDDAYQAINLGFTFTYDDVAYTNGVISTNGWLEMGQAYLGYSYTNDLASTATGYHPLLAPLWDDLADDSTTGNEIGYVTLGTAPNRTFVVQWRNVRWNYNGTAGDNFQVRLYETTNVVQFVYGSMVTPSSPSASIGINDATGGSGNFISVTPGSPPTYSTTTANNSISVITYLTSGTTYTFTPPVTCPVNWPGPDGYGLVGQTATYSWVEISASGTPVGITGDDSVSGALPLGQAFNLYGTAYTEFYVNTNGLISFGSGYGSYSNYNLPSTSAPNNIIAVSWDDLRVDDGGQIRYETKNPCPVGGSETTCTVIQFSNMYTLGGTSAGTWEAILYPGGNVLLQFQSVGTANSAYSTTGMQGPVSSYPTYGMSYGYNCTGRPAAGTAVKFVYPCAAIWTQALSTVDTNAYANQDFEAGYDVYDIYVADDFTFGSSQAICSIFVPGDGWNGFSSLSNASALNFAIYANAGGVPAGYPGSSLAAPLWSLSVAPTDPRVALSTGTTGYPSNVTLTLNSPVGFGPGTYWLLFYPSLSFSAGYGQFGRQRSDTANGNDAAVINPLGGFGFPTSWTSVRSGSTWGATITTPDFAFQLRGYSLPTSVVLKRFEAWPEGAAMHVQWETSEEIDNTGFNLYRSVTRNGPKYKLNPALIPTKVPPGSPIGAVYHWIDTRVRAGRLYFYWLEDVDVYGHSTVHGPVRVRMP